MATRGLDRLTSIVRWLLVPAAAAAVLVGVTVLARWSVRLIDGRCPEQSMVGGACVEPWHTTAVETAIYAAVAAGAIGLVTVPALLAPQHKRAVAAFGFALVLALAATAYGLMTWPVMLPPLAIALISGAVALAWWWRRNASRETA